MFWIIQRVPEEGHSWEEGGVDEYVHLYVETWYAQSIKIILEGKATCRLCR